MKHIKNFKNVLNMLCIANRTFINLFSKMYHVAQLECRRSGV